MNLSASTHWLGSLVANHQKSWIKLGNLETALLKHDLANIAVNKPIYVCGLARSGSTILLETLANLQGIASHRYQDFPFLFTPYWWNTLLSISTRKPAQKQERAHGDGIHVNSESPEAMEEMLWMAFFPHLHNTSASEVLNECTSSPSFEKFYADHIRKLLLTRKAQRYLSKGNYNITRMAYIQRVFPDARFIIPIRDPVTHVESLVRQHRRFVEAGKKDSRIVNHMSITGHFEFGLNRKPVHMGDDARIKEIITAWESGDDVRGFALYWDMTYCFMYNQMLANKALGKACLVVPFENLCASPLDTIAHIIEHCDINGEAQWLQNAASIIKKPDYYTSHLSDAERILIQDICKETATLFGYYDS
ncbi:MAG: sulfotransferase [Alphaproteobacteria bacterium]